MISPNIDKWYCSFDINIAELQTICKEYHAKIAELETFKYDLEWQNKVKDLEVKINVKEINMTNNCVLSKVRNRFEFLLCQLPTERSTDVGCRLYFF